jgi:hypothetical protein
MRRAFLAACLWLAAGAHAAAAERVPFADGVRIDADGAVVVTRDRELRMPGTSKTRADLPAETRLTRATTVKVRAQGKSYDVDLWNGVRPDGSGDEGGFGASVAVLAVFPDGAKAPTDIAEVAADRETYLDQKVLPLGGDDAFAVFNAHLNAGEDFNLTSLFHLRDGRLRRIAEIALYAARAQHCADSTRQELAWEVMPRDGGLPDIVADVATVRAPNDVTREDCPTRKIAERRTHARTTFRWDAKQDRYVQVKAAADKGR